MICETCERQTHETVVSVWNGRMICSHCLGILSDADPSRIADQRAPICCPDCEQVVSGIAATCFCCGSALTSEADRWPRLPQPVLEPLPEHEAIVLRQTEEDSIAAAKDDVARLCGNRSSRVQFDKEYVTVRNQLSQIRGMRHSALAHTAAGYSRQYQDALSQLSEAIISRKLDLMARHSWNRWPESGDTKQTTDTATPPRMIRDPKTSGRRSAGKRLDMPPPLPRPTLDNHSWIPIIVVGALLAAILILALRWS